MSDARASLLPKIVAALLFGFGPGMSFLIGYLAAPVPEDEKIFVATAIFMAAAVGLMLAYRISRRKLWPLPWTTLLVVIMGGMTLWLQEESFIKIRPTVQFAAAAAIATFALATGRPRLADLERLDPIGQRNLKLMAALFGIAAATGNELVWRNSSTLFWIGYQMWGPVLIFLLAAAMAYPTLTAHLTGQCKVRTTG